MSVRLGRSGEKLKVGWNRFSLSRFELVKVRAKARRRGVWFRVLSRVERGLIDLAIKIVERPRSLVLARSLVGVVEKLLDALESEVTRLMRTVGHSLAKKLSEIAQSWGNESASLWTADLSFVRYLAMIQKNLRPIFRV